MKMVRLLLAALATLSIASCKHAAGWQPEGSFVSGNVDTTSKEFVIPRKLSKIIQGEYLHYIHKISPASGLSDAEILSQIPRDFLNVTMYFVSGSPGVLANNTKFDLPRGGGQVDLAGVVAGKKGSFYMHFNVVRADASASSGAKAAPQDMRVYFMSETKHLKVGGDEFGAGCGRYMDVTNTLMKANQGKGFHLNATGLRYVPVVGGTFYFVSFGPDKKVYLAAVRMVDSRYPNLQCPAPK